MAEIHAQRVRHVLVTAVAEWDNTIVTEKALTDSSEFNAFLAKTKGGDDVDSLDLMEIEIELEEELGLGTVDTDKLSTWQEVFDYLILEMKKA